MSRLETKVGEILTLLVVESSLPVRELMQVENKLLDGSLHIQTIGEPTKIIQIEIFVDRAKAERIDEICYKTEEVYFFDDTKKYRGIIKKPVPPVQWKKQGISRGNDTKYTGVVEFVILEEGIS